MQTNHLLLLLPLICATVVPVAIGDDVPDIRSVPADLVVPQITTGPPAAGRRVEVQDTVSGVPFVVYLPRDWSPLRSFPVILELPGNGGYRNSFGDQCSGLPAGCSLGYGITAGVGAVWIAVPFLNGEGNAVAVTWWGDPPEYDPRPSVDLLRRCLDYACSRELCGDRRRVILTGFSRGSIACNHLGLIDDETAGCWRGMICYSHYDGVHEGWPVTGADRAAAARRLRRLAGIRQFICHESSTDPRTSLSATRALLQQFGISSQLTFCEIGFRNHNDQWILRPSPARRELRAWFQKLTSGPDQRQ